MIQTVQRKEKVHEVDKNNPLRQFRNVHDEFNVIETEVGQLLIAGNIRTRGKQQISMIQ